MDGVLWRSKIFLLTPDPNRDPFCAKPPWSGEDTTSVFLHFQKICKRYNIDFATADEDERDFVIRMAEKSFYSMRA